MPQTQQDSHLVRQAKKFFSEPDHTTIVVRNTPPTLMDEPQVVQSYTTYSLADVPLLAPVLK